MKRTRSLILVINLCLFCKLCAQNPVTEIETKVAAVRYAQLFLQYKEISLSNIVTIDSFEENSITLMREVLFDNGLSIMLSSYKSCLPVLLYSTDFAPVLSDIENIPDGLQDFIHNYAGAIAYAAVDRRDLNEHPDWTLLLDAELSEDVTRSGQIYGPLLTTAWGQKRSNDGIDCSAYNHFVDTTSSTCPTITYPCDTCPTGCVATAMAQIMKYWNYPVYIPNKVEQYDWCNMPDSLICEGNPKYATERNAIAHLMADCGKAAKMKYCKYDCQSFAWPIDARDGLVDTFGYHSDAIRRLRSSHSTKTWKKMLIEDISSGRPVLYGGVSWKSNGYDWGGHAFVCDGYNEHTDKFHFNWGNYGGNNAIWCSVDSIIEGLNNWNHFERAVFNIHPSTTQDYCNFDLPLWTHYHYYYNIYNTTTPSPYANVPKTFTRLVSVPNDPQFPSSWRTIPAGATSEYVAHEEILLIDGFYAETGSDFYAHIVPCESCEERRATGETLDLVGGGNNSPIDTLAGPKSLHTETTDIPDDALSVYPNPAGDLLHIELSGGGGIGSVALYDLQGRVVTGTHAGAPQPGTTTTVNLRNVPAGVYLLRVRDAEGKEYMRKIVKK